MFQQEKCSGRMTLTLFCPVRGCDGREQPALGSRAKREGRKLGGKGNSNSPMGDEAGPEGTRHQAPAHCGPKAHSAFNTPFQKGGPQDHTPRRPLHMWSDAGPRGGFEEDPANATRQL